MEQLNRKGQVSGSALIMAVVLTVLLSMVGIMFIMVARMDKASTSSIIENKELQSAVDSVIEIISQQLVLDTPSPDNPSQEYYDYPGDKDEWLASLEPYDANETYYKWRQISDITGSLRNNFGPTAVEDVSVKPSGRKTILEYQAPDDVNEGELADADGDGVADSKWIELEDMRTSKGKKIYVAVRVIDNSGMLNVNTAYTFDSNSSTKGEIDGSTQTQINLAGLIKDSNDSISYLHSERNDVNQDAWSSGFSDETIWNFGAPHPNYPQFEISDELELRYRYCIDGKAITRLENVWPKTVGKDSDGAVSTPYDGSSGQGLDADWQKRIVDYTSTEADRRHLLTTSNLDRVIDPCGVKMFCPRIIDRDAQGLYEWLKSRIYPTSTEQDANLAQICANIIDYSDSDANVSVVTDTNDYYGFERPFIYISEITRNFQKSSSNPADPNVYRSYAVELYKTFSANEKFDDWKLTVGNQPAIDINASDFEQRGGNYYVIIYESNEPNAWLASEVDFNDSPNNGATGVDPNVVLKWPVSWIWDPNYSIWREAESYDVYFGDTNSPAPIDNRTSTSYDPGLTAADFGKTFYWRIDARHDTNGLTETGEVWNFTIWDKEPNSIIERIEPNNTILDNDSNSLVSLYRDVDVGGSTVSIMVDAKSISDPEFSNTLILGIRSYQRDIGRNNRLKRLWYFDTGSTLGHWNNYPDTSTNLIQPFHSGFETIGEIGKVFRKSPYNFNDFKVSTTEKDVRIDLQDPNMQRIFQYLTVMDPAMFAGNPAAETRVKGRVNINTAPKFLIQQLPWVSAELAEAIVAYRDMTKVASDGTINYSDRNTGTGLAFVDYPLRSEPGFESTGELMTVINNRDLPAVEISPNKRKYSIQEYGLDNKDQRGFPDISTNSRTRDDGAADDLEEKELIFARISDLATVRSDVFTAYVLVRLGTDGPQKRMVAILDRSGVNSETDRVKIRALQLTPDPR